MTTAAPRRTRPAPLPVGTRVRVRSTPRGVGKEFVNREGFVVNRMARGRHVVRTEAGDVTLTAARLEAVTPAAPASPPEGADEVATLWHYWPDLRLDGHRLLPRPAEADLRGEIEAVRREYGANGPVEVTCEPTAYVGGEFYVHFQVSFQTERITLRRVPLGAFRVTLSVSVERRFGSARVSAGHETEALDPNPAACDERITHPHVSDNEMCLGETRHEWADAMAGGRLSDAAFLMNAVLHNWTPETAFSHLSPDTWHGVPCGNCGERGEEPHGCVHCEEDVCDGCRGTGCWACGGPVHEGCAGELACDAEGCSRVVCGGCEYTVGEHGEGHYCSRCVAGCRGCGVYFEKGELNGENKCPECARPECVGCGDRFDHAQLDPHGECASCRTQNEEAVAAHEAEGGEPPAPPDGDLVQVACFSCQRRPGLPAADGRCMPCHRTWILED